MNRNPACRPAGRKSSPPDCLRPLRILGHPVRVALLKEIPRVMKRTSTFTHLHSAQKSKTKNRKSEITSPDCLRPLRVLGHPNRVVLLKEIPRVMNRTSSFAHLHSAQKSKTKNRKSEITSPDCLRPLRVLGHPDRVVLLKEIPRRRRRQGLFYLPCSLKQAWLLGK